MNVVMHKETIFLLNSIFKICAPEGAIKSVNERYYTDMFDVDTVQIKIGFVWEGMSWMALKNERSDEIFVDLANSEKANEIQKEIMSKLKIALNNELVVVL